MASPDPVREALERLYDLVVDGLLVRNTVNDGHMPSYLVEATRITTTLAAVAAALRVPAPSGKPENPSARLAQADAIVSRLHDAIYSAACGVPPDSRERLNPIIWRLHAVLRDDASLLSERSVERDGPVTPPKMPASIPREWDGT